MRLGSWRNLAVNSIGGDNVARPGALPRTEKKIFSTFAENPLVVFIFYPRS
jgi:hypothetical protein